MTVILQPQDDLDLKAAAALRIELFRLADTSHDHWSIDLANVDSVGNVGLVTLIEANKYAKQAGRRFSLSNLKESVQYILAITELDRYFDIVDDRDRSIGTIETITV
ncbi:MAG: STAS domain-containing protein [Cyanobacteriota bacterium]|nr:STAS domain-containing protein [Cyanobacteriota bacterium]